MECSPAQTYLHTREGQGTRAAVMAAEGSGARAGQGPAVGAGVGCQVEATGAVAKGWVGEGTEGRAQEAGGLAAPAAGTAVMATAAAREVAARDAARVVAGARQGPGTGARVVGWHWGCSGRWSGWHRRHSANLQQVGGRNSTDGKRCSKAGAVVKM